MVCPPFRLGFIAAVVVLMGWAACRLQAAEPGPQVHPESVPGHGSGATDITIPSLGRYSIDALGGQGSTLTLVDRMSGPGATDGVIGERNGRIDTFLDAGTYRVRVASDPAGTGDVRVQVHAFAAVGDPGVLPDDSTLPSTTLTDLQQRSWWVEAGAGGVYEAVGRSLADLRLWRDGRQLVSAEPECVLVGGQSPHPLRRCALVGPAEPGVYQLVAYGGAALPWSDGLADQPLTVRRGVPELRVGALVPGVMSAFGIDRVRLDHVGWARLSLPAAASAAIAARPWSPTAPLGGTGTSARIAEDSRLPWAELYLSGLRAQAISVTAAPGQPYTLQALAPEGPTTALTGVGPVLVATLHSGNPLDNVDATGVVLATVPTRAVLAASAVRLDAPYRRRFNLSSTATLYVEATSVGRWALSCPGANLRIEPFFAGVGDGAPPQGYQSPPLAPDAAVAELAPGLYVVTLEPRNPGVSELTMRPAGGVGVVAERAPRAAVIFPSIPLAKGTRATLYMGTQPGVVHGVVVQSLPWKLTGTLTLALGPGESVDVPVLVGATAELVAPDVELWADDAAAAQTAAPASVTIQKGEHVLHLRNPASVATVATIAGASRAEGGRRGPSLERMPIPASIDEHPAFVLGDAPVERSVDLDAGASETWAVEVRSPGLYRIESSGLLAMAGELDTRFATTVAIGESNGDGRNFRLLPWLSPGSYLLTVRALGKSAGHAGIRLAGLTLRSGGGLPAERTAGAALAAAEGITYELGVPEAGTYTLQVDAPGESVPFRLDDAEGWPLVKPGTVGRVTLDLEAGTYLLTELPLQRPVRRETRLARVLAPAPTIGHGPHVLPLDATVAATWMEDAPDVWTFTLPARVEATVGLGPDVTGALEREGKHVAALAGGRGYSGWLDPGGYTLRVISARGDNAVPYSVSVLPTALVAGMSRSVATTAEVPLAVGTAGLYRIETSGSGDVRGWLVDDADRLVAEMDDGEGRWNFTVTRVLAPGIYRLKLRPVGPATGTTVVGFSEVVPEEALPIAAAGTSLLRVEPSPAVAALDGAWVTGAAGRVLGVRVHGGGGLSLAIERAEASGAWGVVAEVEGAEPMLLARTAPGGRYRLRWGTNEAVSFFADVEVTASDATGVDGRGLTRGVSAPRVAKSVAAGVWAPRLDPPGVLGLAAGSEGWMCPEVDHACAPVGPGPLPVSLDPSGAPVLAPWLVVTKPGSTLRAARITVGVGPEAGAVELPVPARVEVAGARGDAWVVLRATSSTTAPVLAAAAGRSLGDAQLTGAGGRAVLAVSPGAGPVDLRGAPGRASVVAGAVSVVGPTLALVDQRLTAALPGGNGRGFVLSGAHVVTLAMEPGLVARVVAPDRDWTLAGAPDQRLYTFAITAGAELTVLNDGGAERVFDLSVMPGDGMAPGPAPVTPAGRVFATRGAWVLPLLPQGTPQTGGSAEVWAHGEVRGITLVTPTGVRSGAAGVSIPLDECEDTSCRLTVDHDPGRAAVWTRERGAITPWADGSPVAVDLLGLLPAVVPLSGPVTRFAVQAPGPGLLRLDAPGVGLVLLERAGAPARVEVPDGAGRVDLPMDAGITTVSCRGFGGAPLAGAASVDFRVAMRASGGGVWRGPDGWLAPGDAVPYLLHVAEHGLVAFGVRAADVDVGTTLYTLAGARVGSGRSQSHALPPGDYLYVIHAGPMALPGRARALIAGGSTGRPPVEEVRRLAAAAGRVLPEGAAAAGWEDLGHTDTGSARGRDTGGEEYDGEGSEGGGE